MFIVTLGLAIGGLVLSTEMASAGFIAFEGVETHQFAELEEIGDAARTFERDVERFIFAEDCGRFPELAFEFGNPFEGALQTGFAAGHSAVVPHDESEFAMERLHRAPSFDGQEAFDAIAHLVFRLLERGMIGGWSLPVVRSKVVSDGGRNDEVPVG